MGLTLEEANRILRGPLAKAQELSIKISAAICGKMPEEVILASQTTRNPVNFGLRASGRKALLASTIGHPRAPGAGGQSE